MATWTKADLLADIAATYIGVGTSVNPNNEGQVNGVTKYMINVNEVGVDANDKPIGNRKNLVYYVYNEGQETEQAWYDGTVPKPTV
jgi:hypothetical protein